MQYHIVQNVRGPKLLRFSQILLKPQMFFHKFQSVLALVDIVLMQTQNFFHEYSHGNLTVNVLSLGSFVLYDISCEFPFNSHSGVFSKLYFANCTNPYILAILDEFTKLSSVKQIYGQILQTLVPPIFHHLWYVCSIMMISIQTISKPTQSLSKCLPIF